jgi:hypothetical protein
MFQEGRKEMIAMSEIKRNKGMIEFWVDNKTKPYILDINKGKILGLRGSALQSIPLAVRNMARQSLSTAPSGVMRLVLNNHMKADWYSWADRLDNIGYHTTIWELNNIFPDLISGFFDLGKFAKWFKENPNEDLEEYMRVCRKSEWLKETGLHADEMLTEEMIDWIYRGFHNQPVHNVKVIAYWLTRGAWEYHNGERYHLRTRINEMCNCANELGWALEKSDYFRQYINLHRAYQQAQDKKANLLMREYQEFHRNALTFETETHTVIIPTTVEELRNEGKAQGNCVGGYGASIVNKRLNVVFVRRKSNPNKSYITCDIDRYGHINQYLASYNDSVSNEEDMAFKRLFQNHLLANWVMGE